MKTIFLNGLKIENAKNKENIIEIEGWACHFNRANLNKEIVDEKSFDKFFDMYKNGVLKPNLNYNHSDQLIGGIDDIVAMNEGLFMQAHLNKDVALVRDTIWPLIESDDLNSFSTEGYIDNGWKGIVENDDDTYYVKDFILLGVAIVANPADWDAKFTLKNYIDEYRTQKEAEKVEIEKQSKWYLIR